MIDYGVIGILLFMSVIVFAIVIERVFFFKTVNVKAYKTKEELEIELTKGLHVIASVASNAPYVGLLGTVLGILITFYTIGEKGIVETKEIMVGLALALKATAVGLLVAIPSVIAYNFLVRKVNVILAMWEIKNGKERD